MSIVHLVGFLNECGIVNDVNLFLIEKCCLFNVYHYSLVTFSKQNFNFNLELKLICRVQLR